jgi:hypothetical protein
MIWKEEPRDAFVKPADVGEVRIEPDEINGGRVKATLSFSLPRGSYATMLIKRLFAPSYYDRGADRYGDRGGDRGDRGGERGPRGRDDGDYAPRGPRPAFRGGGNSPEHDDES